MKDCTTSRNEKPSAFASISKIRQRLDGKRLDDDVKYMGNDETRKMEW